LRCEGNRSSKLEPILNLKRPRPLGLTVLKSVLTRADEVID